MRDVTGVDVGIFTGGPMIWPVAAEVMGVFNESIGALYFVSTASGDLFETTSEPIQFLGPDCTGVSHLSPSDTTHNGLIRIGSRFFIPRPQITAQTGGQTRLQIDGTCIRTGEVFFNAQVVEEVTGDPSLGFPYVVPLFVEAVPSPTN